MYWLSTPKNGTILKRLLIVLVYNMTYIKFFISYDRQLINSEFAITFWDFTGYVDDRTSFPGEYLQQ